MGRIHRGRVGEGRSPASGCVEQAEVGGGVGVPASASGRLDLPRDSPSTK